MAARSFPLPVGHVEERERRAREYLHGVAERLRHEGVEVETRVAVDAASAHAILAAATGGRGGPGGDVHARTRRARAGASGRRRHKVLRGSTVPVLLERPEMDHLAR